MNILTNEESYHYWRECHNCGHAGAHYLHCLHDMVQSDCVKCGNRLLSIFQDCDCEFVLTETQLEAITQTALLTLEHKIRREERENMMELLHLSFDANHSELDHLPDRPINQERE